MSPSAPDPMLIPIFKAEVEESIEVVRDHLLHIEQDVANRGPRVEDVLRLAHDLKGSARVVGYELVGHLAHALETHLLRWRHETPSPESSDAAFRASDLLRALSLDIDDGVLQARARRLVTELTAACDPPARTAAGTAPTATDTAVPAAPAAPAAEATPAPQPTTTTSRPSDEMVRVARRHVDAVADDVAVMLLDTLGAQVRVEELQRALQAVKAARLPREGATAREVARTFGNLRAKLADLVTACNLAKDSLNQFGRHTPKLDEDTRALCLVPIKPLLQHLWEVARNAGRALGREVRVETDDRELKVDRTLLEALKDPLTHAVRNAVDHGIETPAERAAAGKPPAGTLRLAVSESGDRLNLTISDDGRGIDRAAVRRRLGERAAGLDDRQLLRALLHSGVSTRDTVTEISGRGLGLGALAVAADRLRGDIEISSPPGAGTTLKLSVPLRLSTLDGLVVEVAGNRFVFPLAAIVDISRNCPPEVPALATLLGLPDAGRPTQVVRLLVRGREVAVAVDAVHEKLEVVRRPTGAHLGSVPFVEGATILPHGEPALILDPREIADACSGHSQAGGTAREGRSAGARRRILLADDSATLRAKLQHDLIQAGFDVVLAHDGQHALDCLAAISCDALVSDIQMPRLDGLELLARCAGRLPVVLITAFPDARGEARARELGAADYIVKDERLGERITTILNRTLTRSQDTRP